MTVESVIGQGHVAELRSLVEAIQPADVVEVEHRAAALRWLAGTTDVYRRARPATPDPHLVSYFVVVDPARTRTLLVEHRLAGMWLPPGGHVEPGEHPTETVRREAREELGLEAEFAEGREAPDFITCTRTVGPGQHTDVSLWFLLIADPDTPMAWDDREFAGVRWWSREQVACAEQTRLEPHLLRFLDKVGLADRTTPDGDPARGHGGGPGAAPGYTSATRAGGTFGGFTTAPTGASLEP